MCFFSCSVFKDLPRCSLRARFDNIPPGLVSVNNFFKLFFEMLFSALTSSVRQILSILFLFALSNIISDFFQFSELQTSTQPVSRIKSYKLKKPM